MKLVVTSFKPSGKHYDRLRITIPALHPWEQDFKPELRSAVDINHDFAYLVENDPEEEKRAGQPGRDLPFHFHLYYPGDLEP